MHVGILLINGKESLHGKEKEIFLRKRVLTSKEEKNIKESIFKTQVLKSIGSLGKLPIVQQGKIIAGVGHSEKYDIMQMNIKIRRITSLLKHWEI